MPFPNEHAARQLPPGPFVRFRRQHPEGFPAGIDAIFGVGRDGKTAIQSLRANAKQWTVGEFRAWLEDHKFKTSIEKATGEEKDMADSTERVRRYDRMALRRKPRHDEKTGFLHADATLTRAPAVFPYKRADGSIIREFRPAEHVMAPRNLDSIKGAIVTDDHPTARVTTRNVRRFQVGQAGSDVQVVKDTIEAPITVTDENVIASMQAGKQQTSLGYDCDLLMQPGIWTDANGREHPYDAIQQNHETNHIAIVHEGRAGADVRVHMDSTDAFQVDAIGDDMTEKKTDAATSKEDMLSLFGGGDDKARVRVDGIEIELPTSQAQAVAKAIADREQGKTDAVARVDKVEAERDAAIKERDELKAKTGPEAIAARVDARIDLTTKAREHVTDKEWPEASKLDDAALRRFVVVKVHKDAKLDEKSDEYIAAAFDLIKVKSDDGLRNLSKTVTNPDPNAGHDRHNVEKKINDAMREADERWRKPVPGGFTKDGKTP